MAKPAIRKSGAKPFAGSRKSPETIISVADRDFQVSKVNITWSDGKTETLYPGDIRQKITYLIGRVATLKNKKPEGSKMFYRSMVYWHSLNYTPTEKELKVRGKSKRLIYSLLKNSSKPM